VPPGLFIPAIQIGQEQWYLLSYHGTKHRIRFIGAWQPRNVKDRSDHGVREVNPEGGVKWRPRDPNIRIQDVAPLGPRK